MNEPVKNRHNDVLWTEVPEFVPTTEELVQLIKYWTKEILGIYRFCFVLEQSVYEHNWVIRDANGRIDRIANCLDDTIVKEAVKEAENEFADHSEAWRIYRHGTDEERKAFLDKVHAEMAKKAGDEFYTDLMKFLSGELCDIQPGTVGMTWAVIAKVLVDHDPELTKPANKERLLKEIHEIEHTVTYPLNEGEIALAVARRRIGLE